ncbi:MAG: hypothetical protein PHS53_04620 [Candidatus Pacebacteria bacterium]|nr:hypothetical protein [Candidatus Paceibacterota bacterium]MDD5357403.1 hypothetical protein [Candidatus Paceibacterota bacterium]
MISFPTQGLGEKIVDALRTGPFKTGDLIQYLREKKVKGTIQGIYKSLRVLRKQHIVLMQKKEVVLNQSWLRQMGDFAALAEHAYRHPASDSGHFLQMQDGDRITYEFKDPIQVDIFWNHVLYVLFDALPKVDRWYAYASHCWFLLGRRKDELALRDYMVNKGICYLFTVGNKTPLDRLVAKDFDRVNSKYHMLEKPLFPKRKNSLGLVLNIVGDYVIEAQYDKHITDRIEQFYKTNTIINPEKTSELQAIVSLPSRIKFTITKDAEKAAKLSRMFEKNFYFKKQKL